MQKASGSRTRKNEEESPGGQKRHKTELDVQLAKALKLKAFVQKTISKFGEVSRAVENRPEWAWARIPGFTKAADDAYKSVNANITDFANDFIVREPKDMKASYSEASLTTECENLVKTLEPCVKKLDKELNVLLGQHKVKQELA